MCELKKAWGVYMSRKIDALVAEHVMGLDNVRFEEYYSDYVWAHSRGKKSIGVPDYSTDIAAAWEVVEKFDLWEILNESSGVLVEVRDLAKGGWFDATADSAPMAICLAALKGKRVDV